MHSMKKVLQGGSGEVPVNPQLAQLPMSLIDHQDSFMQILMETESHLNYEVMI